MLFEQSSVFVMIGCVFFFFQAEDGIRDLVRSRGLGDVYKRQGMLFSLGVLWVTSELLHDDRESAMESGTHILKIIRRIDTPSVLFFLGILTAVSALQASGLLGQAASLLDQSVGNISILSLIHISEPTRPY